MENFREFSNLVETFRGIESFLGKSLRKQHKYISRLPTSERSDVLDVPLVEFLCASGSWSREKRCEKPLEPWQESCTNCLIGVEMRIWRNFSCAVYTHPLPHSIHSTLLSGGKKHRVPLYYCYKKPKYICIYFLSEIDNLINIAVNECVMMALMGRAGCFLLSL